MMSVVDIINNARRYRERWNKTLEDVTKSADKEIAERLLRKNRERPFLGSCGYGTILFSDLFDIRVEKVAPLVDSCLVFMMGIIDDNIDISGKTRQLEDIYEFIETGKGYMVVAPLRNFAFSNFDGEKCREMINALRQYALVSQEEFEAESYDKLKRARVLIGEAHGTYSSVIINSFGNRKLSEVEIRVLQLFGIGCSLLDCVSDYYQDIANGKNTFVTSAIRKSGKFKQVMTDESQNARKYFAEGEKLLGERKIEGYREIVRFAETYYCFGFLCKSLQYFLRRKSIMPSVI